MMTLPEEGVLLGKKCSEDGHARTICDVNDIEMST